MPLEFPPLFFFQLSLLGPLGLKSPLPVEDASSLVPLSIEPPPFPFRIALLFFPPPLRCFSRTPLWFQSLKCPYCGRKLRSLPFPTLLFFFFYRLNTYPPGNGPDLFPGWSRSPQDFEIFILLSGRLPPVTNLRSTIIDACGRPIMDNDHSPPSDGPALLLFPLETRLIPVLLSSLFFSSRSDSVIRCSMPPPPLLDRHVCVSCLFSAHLSKQFFSFGESPPPYRVTSPRVLQLIPSPGSHTAQVTMDDDPSLRVPSTHQSNLLNQHQSVAFTCLFADITVLDSSYETFGPQKVPCTSSLDSVTFVFSPTFL